MNNKRLRYIWLIGIALGLLLTGCATAQKAAPGETPTLETKSIEADSLPLPEGAALSFHRSGGFAGVDETWLVYTDGRVVSPDGSERRVEAGQVSGLLADLTAAGFFKLDPAYKPQNLCCDRFTYELIARSGELANRMSAVEGVEDTPPALLSSIQLVEAFLKNVQLPES
jgi:hypothetical protein